MPTYELVRTNAQQVAFLKENVLKILTDRKEMDGVSFLRLFTMKGFTAQDVRAAVTELIAENKIREIP